MLTLKVKVIDKHTSKVLNEEHPHIFIDDSVKTIKEKLFTYNPALLPNFLKVEVENGQDLILVKDSNSILLDLLTYPFTETPTVYITSIENNLHDNLEILLDNSEMFENSLQTIKGEYIDMTGDDFEFALKIVMIQQGKSIPLSDLQYYTDSIKSYRDILVGKYNQIESDKTFQEFCKLSTQFDAGENKIVFNDINLSIIGENYQTGSNGIFIKLDEIYNILELDKNIPFIALGKQSGISKLPQIKVYNKINVNEKEIKSWVLNEKVKLNEATYKIIKGLLIKSKFGENNYLTINILPNGIIQVNYKLSQVDKVQETQTLEILVESIKMNVDNVIKYINTFGGVFLKSKRISAIKDSTVKLESMDTSIETSVFIDKSKFDKLISQNVISENILELKRTESMEFISAYYKKFKIRDNTDDRKGITVNIRDNQYKEDSSIIKIYGGTDYKQTIVILWTVLLCNEMASLQKSNGLFEDFSKKRKIKEKTNKKKLKEQGVNFDSRECQAIRQPTIIQANEHSMFVKRPKKDSYIITFKDNNYRCDKGDYPYPGFTKSNIVCCFKYNQRGNENYIKNVNPESLNILVEPSNFKVTITTNNNTFETFVIKVVSDYQPGFNEENSMPRYYYLSNLENTPTHNDLMPIYNKQLIQKIEDTTKENIWLEKVPLSHIIHPSNSSKCLYKPNLNNRLTLDSPCTSHKKNKHTFFGYTTKSVPCCFDDRRDEEFIPKNKNSDVTKHYIIQSPDKILNQQKLGILPTDLSTLLNTLLVDDQKTFYRMGVIQNNSSFFNALLISVNNLIGNTVINNNLEFRKYISFYLKHNTKEFYKLNDGDISNKYTLERYTEYINNNDIFINWKDTIDICEKVLRKNIIILEVLENTIKLVCKPFISNPGNKTRPYIVLLKRKNTFEVIIELFVNADNKNNITREFPHDRKCIVFFLKYYKDTCVKENLYPENYQYIPIPTQDILLRKFKTNSVDLGQIKYQVQNSFNKINFLMTSKAVLIPIQECGMIQNKKIKAVSFSSVIRQTKLLTLRQYRLAFQKLGKMLGQNIIILGKVDSNIKDIGCILTNFGVYIPYKKTIQDNLNKDNLGYTYYLDVDNVENVSDGEYSNYTQKMDHITHNVYELKKAIGNFVSKNNQVKLDLENQIKNVSISRHHKIDNIVNMLTKIPGINKTQTTLLKAIANEMINDNKENLILNNIITSDTFNKKDVIQRDSESILLNVDDIRKWIKLFKQSE